MSDYNSCVDDCDLPFESNELKILVKQLRREVLAFYKDTNESLLKHDGEIAKLCKCIKDNLSNSLRCLLDTMLAEGEIEELIKQTLFANVPLSVKDFRGGWRWSS